ncbi:MAG: putative Ig domain-containing protein [Paludibacter sp.]|nr:putative Ig domain-containing protein [Paludibacter sp.]
MKTKMKPYLFILLSFFAVSTLTAEENNFQVKKTWFDTMLNSCSNFSSAKGSNASLKSVFALLRNSFNNPTDLMEMSWEERDEIWSPGISLDELGKHYKQAYLVSCNERGIKPENTASEYNSLEDVKKIRSVYLTSRRAEYVILTPVPSLSPVINGPTVYGVRPGNDILYKIPVTGEKPMKIEVKGLPSGCIFDASTGIISGRITKEGKYPVIITASNKKGKVDKKFTFVVGDKIALTPPMGWNSWNCFARDVTAENIRNTADALLKSGLCDFGWSYINIDDCWMRRSRLDDTIFNVVEGLKDIYVKEMEIRRKTTKLRFNDSLIIGDVRDENGMILPNRDFEDMKGLTDYLHNRGFKAGIYISPGPWTCQCYAGSFGFEDKDARQFADWGFDYLKYDWCGYKKVVPNKSLEEMKAPYIKMGQSLAKVNRDIVYSLCQYGMGDVWEWGGEVGGNCWRTTGDIRDTWDKLLKIGFSQNGHEKFAKPGNWNDPDMLVVGYVGWSKNLRPSYLSPNEQYTHISLWCLLNSPLLIGCDVTRLDDFTKNLLTNNEVLAVNQDELGVQASRYIQNDNVEVWAKKLSDGSMAVGIFNLGDVPVNYTLNFEDLGLKGKYKVRDLWRQKDVSSSALSFISSVNRHGVTMVKLIAL